MNFNARYLPHRLETRLKAVRDYRLGADSDYVCRKYKVSKSSLSRWNKIYDGTINSLKDKSKRPKSVYKKAHTEIEISNIKNYVKRNPNITICELFGKLKEYKGYTRHISSLYKILLKLNLFCKKKKDRVVHNNPYKTPKKLGVKWQLDIKYVPKECYIGKYPDKFYQYTMIDEASRERFIYAFKEKSVNNTVKFLKMAIEYFGYIPEIIQTDNGMEFTYVRLSDKIHPLDKVCQELKIEHKLIRPRTPEHNGKVERSHRTDNRRFYSTLKFFSLKDLQLQMKRYLKRYNETPMSIHKWKSPIEIRKELFKLSFFHYEKRVIKLNLLNLLKF